MPYRVPPMGKATSLVQRPPYTPEKRQVRRVRFHREMDTRICQKMNCELTEPRLY